MIWIGSTHPAEIAREFYKGSGEPWQTAGDQIAAEIELRGKPLEWQPIETAPKDGQCFLVGIAGEPEIDRAFFMHGELIIVGGHYNATHWMPLPDPPPGV